MSCVRSFDRYIIHVHQEHQRAIHSRSERAVALLTRRSAQRVGIDENRPRATLNDDGEGLCGPWAAIFIS